MSELPCGHLAVFRGVLAQRRKLNIGVVRSRSSPCIELSSAYPNAILELDAADLQRLEDLRDGLAIWLGVEGGTCRRVLRRLEVRDARGRHIHNIVNVGHCRSMGE